jgi:hypothetical protein
LPSWSSSTLNGTWSCQGRLQRDVRSRAEGLQAGTIPSYDAQRRAQRSGRAARAPIRWSAKLWAPEFQLRAGPSSHRYRGVCYPFSSFFNSLRKRQSVPWVMILWGLDLIIPTSLRRRA